MWLLLTVLVVLGLLLVNEAWWRTSRAHGELSRKFVHITVGSFVAFWPFFLSWREIIFLSGAFLVVICLSRYLDLFRAIHSVHRPTWGELFFALAVGLVAFITRDEWIYMAALLQMGLADGLAAVVGTTYGKRTRYRVFRHNKSLVGSVTFFVISAVILSVYAYFATVPLSPLFIIGLALGATIIENIGVRGLDNLLVPLLIAVVLVNY